MKTGRKWPKRQYDKELQVFSKTLENSTILCQISDGRGTLGSPAVGWRHQDDRDFNSSDTGLGPPKDPVLTHQDGICTRISVKMLIKNRDIPKLPHG